MNQRHESRQSQFWAAKPILENWSEHSSSPSSRSSRGRGRALAGQGGRRDLLRGRHPSGTARVLSRRLTPSRKGNP
jgi:hypothetical protein